jgi:putative transposase
MRKSRFTDEQITAILAEGQASGSAQEVSRRHGISTKTYYGWRKKYGGMQSDDVRRLRHLETENSKLKKMVAEQALDIVALKEIVSKKW